MGFASVEHLWVVAPGRAAVSQALRAEPETGPLHAARCLLPAELRQLRLLLTFCRCKAKYSGLKHRRGGLR